MGILVVCDSWRKKNKKPKQLNLFVSFSFTMFAVEPNTDFCFFLFGEIYIGDYKFNPISYACGGFSS